MTTINKRKMHFIPNFEASSVVLVAALAIGASGAASTVHAQTATPAPSAATSPAAASGAGKASAKDLDAAFARADVNKDGKRDKKEAEMMPAVAERFGQLDADSDGSISREEFNKAAGS